jgi:hypothetical protein
MNRSRKISLAVLSGINLVAAFGVWLFLYGRGYAFHLAGVYFTPGILVATGMLLVEVLIFFLLSRKLN